MEPITLLLVDGEPSVLRGLRMRLEVEVDFRVLAEAYRGEDLLAVAHEVGATVVVLDIDVPGRPQPAVDLVESLASTQRIVALSLHDAPEVRRAVERAGATFVRKQDPSTSLFDAIRSAASHSPTARGQPRNAGAEGGAMQ